MEFTIPYEKGKMVPVVLKDVVTSGGQVPFTKSIVREGLYREWISAQTEDKLDEYIANNESILKNRLASLSPNVDPNWKFYQHLAYRNCLYMTEKHLRHSEETVTLDEDLHSYFANWEGKFRDAYLKYMTSMLPKEKPDEKSGVNPYY